MVYALGHPSSVRSQTVSRDELSHAVLTQENSGMHVVTFVYCATTLVRVKRNCTRAKSAVGRIMLEGGGNVGRCEERSRARAPEIVPEHI